MQKVDVESQWTWACEDGDFAAWHGGCPWAAVWVVQLDTPQVRARVQQARTALGDALWPGYARQPHITVAYRGLMAEPPGHLRAEFGAQQWLQDVRQLTQLPPMAFALQLHGVGQFSTVPYLALQASEPLQRLHDALAAQAPYPDWRYVPHVTLGHYAQRLPMAALQTLLEQAMQTHAPLELAVTQLHLVRYRSNAMAGPLHVEGVWDLQTQRYTPHAQALYPDWRITPD